MTYDEGNVFARILRGDMPSHKVYEDDETFAFLDVMPRADGHTLVIPKTRAINLFDVDEPTLNAVMRTVKRLAPAVRVAFEAGGILIQQFNEPAAGQTVFHFHVHIIPRWEGVPLKPHAGVMENSEVLAANADKLRARLSA